METIKTITGNKQEKISELPKIVYLTGEHGINDVALNHIFENTGLIFKRVGWGYEVQPTESKQIVALFMTYNFKTRYFDNGDHKNTLMIKSDYHQGFNVESICFECCKRNHINVKGLKEGDFLAC